MDWNGINSDYIANIQNTKNAFSLGKNGEIGHDLVISGDAHGDFHRFANQNVRNHCRGMYPSHVIILGDFGLIWSTNPDNPQEKYITKWLNDKPWITVLELLISSELSSGLLATFLPITSSIHSRQLRVVLAPSFFPMPVVPCA